MCSFISTWQLIFSLSPWWWRRYGSLKRLSISSRLHSAIHQRAVICIFATVKTLNLTDINLLVPSILTNLRLRFTVWNTTVKSAAAVSLLLWAELILEKYVARLPVLDCVFMLALCPSLLACCFKSDSPPRVMDIALVQTTHFPFNLLPTSVFTHSWDDSPAQLITMSNVSFS
jgi:hypothetical protein